MHALIVYGVTFIATWLLVAATRSIALRIQLLDHPNERSSHTTPTPRGGGIAIVLCATAAVMAISGRSIPVAVYLSALAISALGFIDDLRSLPSVLRLGVQMLCALVAVLACRALPDERAWLAAAVMVLWIAGLTNAYNFMDGIDGIAGLQSVIAGAGWAVCGVIWMQPAITSIGAALAVTSAAFLFHNWSPARIFLGDAGSTFLGFTFAVMPLLVGGGRVAWTVAVLMMWPFLFDTAFTLIRRAYRRENILRAHRSHLYQRLVTSGWSHARVTTLFGALAAICAATAIMIARAGRLHIIAVVVPAICALALYGITVWRESGVRRP